MAKNKSRAEELRILQRWYERNYQKRHKHCQKIIKEIGFVYTVEARNTKEIKKAVDCEYFRKLIKDEKVLITKIRKVMKHMKILPREHQACASCSVIKNNLCPVDLSTCEIFKEKN